MGYTFDHMNDQNEIAIAGRGKTKMLELVKMTTQVLSNSLIILAKRGILDNQNLS